MIILEYHTNKYMKSLEGKSVAKSIENEFCKRITTLKRKPKIVVLGLNVDDSSEVYIRKIEKNCLNYGIGFLLMKAKTQEEFINNFNIVKNDETFTGIMFQQPLSQNLVELMNTISPNRDIEGISIKNMGKLFLNKNDAVIPCTSKAVMKTLEFYGVELDGKNVVVVGRSNIVGKPLIPQLLEKNATVTICHSKTKNLREHTTKADIVIMAVGKAKMLKKDDIKEGAVLIDVGINFENGKIVGDIDFEDVKEKANACTPVPGGIGIVTNAILMDNIIQNKYLTEL